MTTSRPRRPLSLVFRLVLLIGSLLAAKAAHAVQDGPLPPAPTAAQQARAAAAAPSAPALLAPVAALAEPVSPALVRACRWLTSDDTDLTEALAAVAASPPAPGSLRFAGLTTFSEQDLRAALGLADDAQLAADDLLVAASRLWSTGAFSALSVRAQPGGFELQVRESALVRSVRLRGLVESAPEDLLSRLLEPAPGPATRSEPRSKRRRSRRSSDADDEVSEQTAAERRCASLALPQARFARFERGQVKPGLVYRGLPEAAARVLRALRSDGYLLASVEARLSPAGELVVEIDEGRLAALEVRGLEPRLTAEVERALGLRAGEIFSSAELRRALRRLDDLFPFVEHGRATASLPAALFDEALLPDGSRQIRGRTTAREEPEGPSGWSAEPGSGRRAEEEKAPIGSVRKRAEKALRELDQDGDWVLDLDLDRDSDKEWDWDDFHWARRTRTSRTRGPRRGVELLGDGRVALWMRARSFNYSGQDWQLFRHTPVTGFAPGLAGTMHLWDPNDRVHLSIDGDLAWNSRRHSWTQPAGASFFERAGAEEAVDWLLGLRLAIPSLRIAEVGAQVYALTDTADRWRTSPNDSYLWSALANRPDSDYFRRSGVTAMLTLHPLSGLTLGGEVRLDHVWGMNPPGKVWTLFNGDEQPRPPAQVTDGEFGSFLARLEWTTEEVPLHKVGGLWRDPERSLTAPHDRPDSGFSTVNTLEIGSPALTGGPGGHWSKLVSDNLLVLELSGRHELALRARAGFSRDAPLQKQEALGGFGALRGYDFKELRGDASLLGSLELRGDTFGAFLDVGSVRSAGSWIDPKPGAGLQLFFGRTARLEVAWRLDGQARAVPDARLLWGWAL